jgi:ATP-binding cassette subfamily B protein
MAFPHFHQLEARDCAPTCLHIIAKYYGKNYSIEELKDKCAVSKQGVSLQDIIDGAEKIGFNTLSIQLTPDKINEIPLPAILHWRQEHYVVLYKITKSKNGLLFYISDPSFGKVSLAEDIFHKQWVGNSDQGVALLLEPSEDFESKIPELSPKWNPFSKLAKNFFYVFRQDAVKSTASIVLIIIAMVATWLFPTLFRKMIDEGVSGKNIHIVFVLLFTQLIIFISQIIADSLSSILLLQINYKVSLHFLVDYLHKLIKLPLKIFDNKVNSDLMMRMDDNERIQSFLTHNVLDFVISFITLTIFTAMLFYYNEDSFYIFFFFSLFSVGWTILFLNKRKILDYARFAVSSETRNNIYELITEMPEIKINNAHHNKISQWEQLQDRLNLINIKALFLNYYQLIGSNFFNRIKDIFITGVCAYFVIQGKMTIGVMLTIGYLLGQLGRPIETIINVIRGLQDAQLSISRLYDILRLGEENEGKNYFLTNSPSYQIYLNNVSFKYEGSFNPLVLENISMTIPIGKVTAIVGSSGSGKTTLMKLLLAIYPPTQGSVHLDYKDLSQIFPDSWRDKCGVVLQDGFIYSGTYAENIALADAVPDIEKIAEAAKTACIHDFINSLPMKYNTKIGKSGVNLSGGQKQRLLIARAVYKNPEFLFFDEATSSLDANNEMQILNNLQSFFKGRTVLVIAHRLSTVKNADQIIVLEKGRIVECANHDELIKAKGRYFELVKNQLELGA